MNCTKEELPSCKGLAKLGNFVGQLGKNADVAQMLPSLATVSADRFVRKFVAELFLHAQTFLGNICRSVQCWATIQLNLPNSKIQNAQCCSAQHCAQFKQSY